MGNLVGRCTCAIFALLAASGLIERYRQQYPPTPKGLMFRLVSFPWVDLMIIVVGAMVCIQAFADIQVNWFTVEG